MYAPIHHITQDMTLGGFIVIAVIVWLSIWLLKTLFKIRPAYWTLLIVTIFSFYVHWILGVMILILSIHAISSIIQEEKEEARIEELKRIEYEKTDEYKLKKKAAKESYEKMKRQQKEMDDLEKSKPFLKKSLSSKIDTIGKLYIWAWVIIIIGLILIKN